MDDTQADNPYLSVGKTQTDNPYLSVDKQPTQSDNPYLSVGETASQGRGMPNYPALGGAPPNSPGVPEGLQATAGWYDRLPGQARDIVGQAGPAMKVLAGAGIDTPQSNPATGQIEGQEEGGPGAIGTFLAKQPSDYISSKIGGAIDTAANTVSDYLTKGLGAIGVPRPEALSRDLIGYLIGGDLAVHGAGMPREHVTPGEVPSKANPNYHYTELNNPGNIGFGTWAERNGAVTHAGWDTGHAIAGFPDLATGYKAMETLARGKYNSGARTLNDLIAGQNGWTPGNRIAASNIAKYMGISPDEDLHLNDPNQLKNFQRALTVQETGSSAQFDAWSEGKSIAPYTIRERGTHPLRAAGADAAEPREAPAPNRQWFQEQDDKFFALRQKHQADQAQFMEMISNLPEEFKTPEVQERLYKYMENPDSTELSPSEQAFYKTTIEPLKREERDLYEELKKTNLDVSDYDPTYAHRIVKGRAPVFDALSGERGATTNPVSGYKSFTAPSLKARKFYALEDGKGNRKLVALDNGQLTEINKGSNSPIQPDALAKGEENLKGVGDSVKIKGKSYTLKHARTDEIEANTGLRYYKNAFGNTIDNLLRLRAAARAQFLFNELKASPEFMTLARQFSGNQPIPEGWRSVDMPTFRGWALNPKFADMVDDFYGGTKSALGDKLTKINQLAVRSLFLTPTAHLLNTFAMWSVARGFDVATPAGIRSFMIDMPKAFKATFTMNKEYREMLDHGAGLVYSGVKNQDFYRQMMNRLGENIKRVPNQWDPIARIAGVGPSDLIKIIYDGSSKILWGGTDVFLMQRVYELKRKGMSTHDAIVEAEKFIPNYRIPSQVLGSRRFAMLLKDPSLTEFSRYHYGVWKSLAHLANDLAGPKASVAKRFDTIGKIMVGGGLLFGLWPVISYGIQKLTGDKDLEFSPKGSTKIPADLLAWYNGDKQFIDVVSDSIIMAPVLKEGLEQFFNTNFFQAGHNMPGASIVDKVDQQKGLAHQALIRGQHAASSLNAPYGLLEQAGRPHNSLEKSALGLTLGTRHKPKKYVPSKYDYKSHGRRPKGLIEKGIDKL